MREESAAYAERHPLARSREEELLEIVEQPLKRGDAHYSARDGEDHHARRSRPGGIRLPDLQNAVYQEPQRPGLQQGDQADRDDPDHRRYEPAPVGSHERQKGLQGHERGPLALTSRRGEPSEDTS